MMIRPAKVTFLSVLAALGLCLLDSAHGQTTVSFTNSGTALGNTNFVSFTLDTFDTSLGTLTGVTVTLNFVTIDGDFTINALTAAPVDFNSAAARITVRENPTNSLGFTLVGPATNLVTTTPAPFEIPGNTSQLFTITPSNVLTGQTQTISNSFWSAYQTAGSGTIAFEVQNNPRILVLNDQSEWDSERNNFTATANMTVSYTYTGAAIPEPSTVAAGAFLSLVAAATYWRRRRNAR